MATKYHRCPTCTNIQVETEGGPMWMKREQVQGKARLSWDGDRTCPKCLKQEELKSKITAAAGTTH